MHPLLWQALSSRYAAQEAVCAFRALKQQAFFPCRNFLCCQDGFGDMHIRRSLYTVQLNLRYAAAISLLTTAVSVRMLAAWKRFCL
ncbi:MAG: hypothetical protein D3916_17410 [Candidatus Electrothrix sp. MAN1_4]|nr:hypothetical protein [Candidatus Electrothrix sp. MAN1_4]